MSPPFPPEDHGGIKDTKFLEINRLINLFYSSHRKNAFLFAVSLWGQATRGEFGPREIADAAWGRFVYRLHTNPDNYAILQGESGETRGKRWKSFFFSLIAKEVKSTRRHLGRQKRSGEVESLSVDEFEDSHGDQLVDPNSSTPLFCKEIAEELFVWRAKLDKVFQAIIDVYADGHDDSSHKDILIEVNKRLDRSERLSQHQLRTRREQLAAMAKKNTILRSLFRKTV